MLIFRSTPCDEGFYTNITMTDECFPCPAGFACDDTNISDFSSFACEAGYWCDGAQKFPCSIGFYNPRTHGNDDKDCLPCPAGYFCSEERITALEDRFLCPAGFFCEKNTQSPQRCPVGNYCPELPASEAGNSPQICPAGTKCLDLGISDVTTAERICDAGKYCKAGITSDSDKGL